MNAPVTRRAMATPPKPITVDYFTDDFISSGSFLLDLVLGGGWARKRVANIVGDKSAGKTLLAIEATANFAKRFDPADVRYAEAEAAFDEDYAHSIGLPDGVIFTGEDDRVETVEDFHNDLERFLKGRRKGAPCMYILDSLDALSDDAEMDRKIGEASYGTGKAKALSESFRRLIGTIRDHDCSLLVISQIRDNIGVSFGETKKRSGGRALDFYCSQVIWLSETGKIKRTIRGTERVIGANVKIRCKKNKVGTPFREADISVIFSYGVDDEVSMIDWLAKHKALDRIGMDQKEALKLLGAARASQDRTAVVELREILREAVYTVWMDIENDLKPKMSKYS